jgi:predicted RNA-binding Zn-ribbon protein involved in translation (DUF1610 family)
VGEVDDDAPVIVARFGTVAQAELARSALDAAGIDAEVTDEEVVTMNWLYSNAVGGVRLLVAAEDQAEAIDVLTNAALPDGAAVAPSVAEEPPLVIACPACGSTDFSRIPRLRLFLFFTVVLYGLGLAIHQQEMALAGIAAAALITAVIPSALCNACGEKWHAPPASRTQVDAPPPSDFDLVEEPCPRCGSAEFYRIPYRRLKAMPMLFNFAILLVVPMWAALPKKQCDQCGFKR